MSMASPGDAASSASVIVVYGPAWASTARVVAASDVPGAAMLRTAAVMAASRTFPMVRTLYRWKVPAQELPGGGARERVRDQDVVLGDLEAGQALGDVRAERVGGRRRLRVARADERDD